MAQIPSAYLVSKYQSLRSRLCNVPLTQCQHSQVLWYCDILY